MRKVTKEFILTILAGGIASIFTFWGIYGILNSIGMENEQKNTSFPEIIIVPVSVENSGIAPPSSESLSELNARLQKRLSVKYVLAQEVLLPQEFLSKERGQLQAERALLYLAQEHKKKNGNALRVLFVTSVDLYLPGYNFIFGLAQPGGSFALVSDARFQSRTMPTEREKELYLRRLSKVALHELGHTFGLPHSDDPKSVMKFHNSLRELDETGDELTEEDKRTILSRHPSLKKYLH